MGGSEIRIVCWDLESTDLKGDFGRLICGCLYDLHTQQLQTFRRDKGRERGKDALDDRKLAVALREALEACDIWVDWNSKLFDAAFLNTRLAAWGERPLNKRMHIDLMYYARRPFLTLRSSRLQWVQQFFHTADEKTPLLPEIWQAAAHEHHRLRPNKHIDLVVAHCIADVKVLAQVYGHLKVHVSTIHR